MQIIALIPGTSRSGITITAGLFGGMNKQTAIKFSFLAGVPLIFGAGVYKLMILIRTGLSVGQIDILIVGFISAFISGLLAIKLLLWMANKGGFKVFVIYRIILGLILLLVF
jgi:undecaprenyl-diphosphatase